MVITELAIDASFESMQCDLTQIEAEFLEDGGGGGAGKFLIKRKLDDMGSAEGVQFINIKSIKRSCANTERVSMLQNGTLQSNGNENVILIKAVGENANRFLNDPLSLAKGLKESEFGKIKDIQVRTNKIRKVAALEILGATQELREKLITVNRLDKWEVLCYVPKVERTVAGVIDPINLNVELN